MGYGQSYYTLRSIFVDGVPPPAIHMHLRRFDVRRDVPIGDVGASDPARLPEPSRQRPTVEVDVPDAEKVAFERWLRELWRAKDAALDRWHDTGSFASADAGEVGPGKVEIPLRLRSLQEKLDAFCFFLPALAWYVRAKVKRQ
jgi:hypothetical protein